MVGRDPAGRPLGRAWLALEVVLDPACRGVGRVVAGTLQHDLVALPADAAEGAIRIDEIEGIEGRVHDLSGGQHVRQRVEAQEGDDGREGVGGDATGLRLLGSGDVAVEARTQGRGQQPREEAVVERGHGHRDRQPVEERQVAAQDQEHLEHDDQPARHQTRPPRTEDEEWGDELDQVIEEHLDLVEPRRGLMKVPGERVRIRLRLVVIDETREVAPAGVPPQLDEAGAEHQPEDEPAQEDDHDG